MKILKNLAICLAVLALSAVTVKSNEPGKTAGKATIRTVKGTATYELNGVQKQLKPNTDLPAGVKITTGPDSEVYMSVNGISSAVRIGAESTMAIPTMDKIGKGPTAETETMLDLKNGNILGQVKKVGANSKYEITTPRGVAGIRGTDFRISVSLLPGGGYSVTFTSVSGTVFVTAQVGSGGGVQNVTLRGGEQFTSGANVLSTAVVTVETAIMSQYNAQISQLLAAVVTLPLGATVTSAPIRPVFNGGIPPTTSAPGLPPLPSSGGTPPGGG